MERGGYGMMRIHDLDDERSFEEVEADREWDWNCMNERRKAWDSFQVFTPPSQYHEVYEKEIDRECLLRAERGEDYTREQVIVDLENGISACPRRNLVADRVVVARVVVECGFQLCDQRDLNPAYTGQERAVWKHFSGANVAALQTQYVHFKIPNSAIRTLKVRIGDHAQKNGADLDTYSLGITGVLKVLEELSDNVGKYEKVYGRWGGMRDLLGNGCEGFQDVG
jgi:hypothetical protein